MKRLFFSILCIVAFSQLNAQSKVGLSFTGSPSLSWLNSDVKEVEKGGAVLGYDFGINADFYFSDEALYSVTSGVLITSVGGELAFNTDEAFSFAGETLDPATKVKYILRYLEVPLVVKMKTSQFHRTAFWGQFGLSGMLNISAKGTSNDEVLDKLSISDEVNMFNVALNVGLGFDYDLGGNNAVTCGLVFKNGFTDISSNSDIDDKTIMNTIKLKLGIVF